MSLFTIAFLAFALLILVLFFWALGRGPKLPSPEAVNVAGLQTPERRSVAFWPQVRQALSLEDLEYVKRRAPERYPQIARERRAVALEYLRGLKHDFEQMLELATAIAVLSPEVPAVHEWERLKLTLQFWLQYRTVQVRLLCRAGGVEGLHELNATVSGLMVKLDEALRELGEHAAVAFELKSTFNPRRLRGI